MLQAQISNMQVYMDLEVKRTLGSESGITGGTKMKTIVCVVSK